MAETVDLVPIAVDLDAAWTPTPDANKWQRIDDHGDAAQDSDYITGPNPPSATGFDTYFVEALSGDDSDRVVRVVVGFRLALAQMVGAITIYPRVRRGTTNVDLPSLTIAEQPAATIEHREVLVDVTSYRPDGGAWERSDFGSGAGKCSFGLAATYTLSGFLMRCTALWVACSKQPVGVLLRSVRRAASATAWRGRRVPVIARTLVGAELGGLDLGQTIYASDTLGPTPEGQGWGVGLDEARPLRVQQLDEDLSAHTLQVQALVLRGQVVLCHDSGRSVGAARTPSGVTQLHQPGVATTFERSSKAWVEQPDGRVGELLIDEEPLDRYGRLHEGGATNNVKWSAFQDGETVWTRSGGATFGTDEHLFEPVVGGRYLSTPAGESAAQSGITLYGESWHALSFDYRTLTGATAKVRLQRSDTSEYWNVGTNAWQAGSVDNALPAAATRARATLHMEKPETPNRTYTLTLLATGGEVRWWHVQSEKARKGKGWPSSRIVTRAAAVTRAHTSLETSNNVGARSWPGLDGTVRLRWRPAFGAFDAVGGGAFTLWRAIHADNEIEARYVPPATLAGHGALELLVTSGGIITSTSTASLELDVEAGTVYRIALRWQSRSQNGDAPGTISVWCEGQVARAASDSIVEADESTVARGSRGNADGTQAEGWIWDEIAEPFVLSDGELEDW